MIYQIVFGILLVIELSCGSGSNTEAKNYKNAYLMTVNDSTFLKLKGKRVLLHDPGTYEDSIMFFLPKLSGRINGEDIPAPKGYYKYLGFIIIDSNKVKVNLLLNNTDDKRIDTSTWNGVYNLTK